MVEEPFDPLFTGLLIVLSYAVLTPLGLFLRLTGKRMLKMAWNESRGSYWEDREHNRSTKEEYERQF